MLGKQRRSVDALVDGYGVLTSIKETVDKMALIHCDTDHAFAYG